MRTYAFAIAAAALFVLPSTGFSQGIQIGPGGVQVDPQYRGRSVGQTDCEQLRKACLNKEELGEQGEGNCRQYRRLCKNR
jgi:hypothetical protein